VFAIQLRKSFCDALQHGTVTQVIPQSLPLLEFTRTHLNNCMPSVYDIFGNGNTNLQYYACCTKVPP